MELPRSKRGTAKALVAARVGLLTAQVVLAS
jgi:hypothetical protein